MSLTISVDRDDSEAVVGAWALGRCGQLWL